MRGILYRLEKLDFRLFDLVIFFEAGEGGGEFGVFLTAILKATFLDKATTLVSKMLTTTTTTSKVKIPN